MKNEPHIPTLFGLFLLLAGLGGGIFLLENRTAFFSRAANNQTPDKVTFSNITDEEFTVSWITRSATNGTIQYQENSPLSAAQTAKDLRDPDISTAKFRLTHMVRVNALKPQTSYVVKIVSGDRIYTDTKYIVTTGKNLPLPNQAVDPAFGTLSNNKNQPVRDALVQTAFSGSQTLATLTDLDGSWMIPLANLRTSDGGKYFVPETKDQETITISDGRSQSTIVTNILNDSPVPSIRLGENYNLTKLPKQKKYQPIIAQAQSDFSNLQGSVNGGFRVTTPEEDAAIPSGKPNFSGTGVAGKSVIITVTGTSAPIATNVTISKNGIWSWTPSNSLDPGNYSSTFVSVDGSGKNQVLSVSFLVLKSGTSVLGDATPSASIKPSSSGPLPSVTPIPRSNPTATLRPSAVSSSSATPKTGTIFPYLIFGFLGLILFISGVFSIVKAKLMT